MVDTWAEYDLEQHLARLGRYDEETERRLKTCMLCGAEFDPENGKALSLYRSSPIRIKGRQPDQLFICNNCYEDAEEIESEDDYEF